MRHLSWKILIAKRTAITPVIGEIGYVVILFFWLEFFGALAEVDGTGCVSFSAGHFARLDLSERRRSRFPIDHSHPRKGTCYAKGTMLRMASDYSWRFYFHTRISPIIVRGEFNSHAQCYIVRLQLIWTTGVIKPPNPCHRQVLRQLYHSDGVREVGEARNVELQRSRILRNQHADQSIVPPLWKISKQWKNFMRFYKLRRDNM